MRAQLRLPQIVGYEVEDAKAAIRQVVREHRRTRRPADLARLGEAFAETALQAIGNARSVALYVSVGQEPPTLPLLERLRARDVPVLLPALGPSLSRRWAFYRGPEDLVEQAPGRPPSPAGALLDADAISSVDVVITPGLAIDGFGNRLGQGGGWYDRMLTLVDQSVPTFTMLFDDELLGSELPHGEHDVPIKAVITPTRVFLLAGSQLEKETRQYRLGV